MATQVQFRRGTTAETAAFTGAIGEVTVDTSKDTLVVHDGGTVGGFPLMRESGANSALADGSLGSPALRFASSSTTGLYSPSAGRIALVASGVAALTSDTGGNLTTGGSITATGSLTGHSFIPTSSVVPANGLYLSAANTVSIATNSAVRFTVGPTGDVTITGALSIGSNFSATSFVPTGSTIPTNGLYLPSANNVAIATNSASRLTINSTGDVVVVTGSLTTSSGTNTAQSFIPTSSTIPANGMYLSAANTLAFATNSVSRLTIDASGTVNVTGSFSVGGSFSSGSFIPTSNSVPTNGLYLPSANNVALATDSSSRLAIDATGNVTVQTGNLTTSSGTNTAQSFIPTSSTIPTNGLYLSGVNTVALATNSLSRFTIDASGNAVLVSGSLTASSGTVTSGSFIPTSSSAPTNGLYLSAANTVSLATNSTARLTIDGSGNVTLPNGTLTTSSGSNTAQSFIPSSSTVPSNGMYLSAANTLGFATSTTLRATISSAGLALRGTTSGSTTISAPATAGNNTLTLPTGNGNNRQMMSTNGSGVLSFVNVLTYDTVKSSASGTTVDFTGIPSWVRRITVMFRNVSTNGTSPPIIRLGTSSGLVSTGYDVTCSAIVSSTAGTITTTNEFLIGYNTSLWAAARVIHGTMVFTNLDSNDWTGTGAWGANTAYTFWSQGSVPLGGTLDRLTVTTLNGTDAFDGGTINIFYEC